MQFKSIAEIISLFEQCGCETLTVKKLAKNDNSKNQIYLGGHEAIQLLPSKKTTYSRQTSKKSKAENFIFRNELEFFWLNNEGPHIAEHSKLIYYPQYPEVRFSGFLKGSKANLSEWFKVENRDKWPQRILFLGSNKKFESYGYVAVLSDEIEKFLKKKGTKLTEDGTFFELLVPKAQKYLPLKASLEGGELQPSLNSKKKSEEKTKRDKKPTKSKEALTSLDSKKVILNALKEVHKLGWVESCKLNKDGEKKIYKAQNGGGYTLEAILGVIPNGDAEPDYMGWEVKQHASTSKVITLFTPEPDGGIYNQIGARDFTLKYGYPDTKGRDGRTNFGGIYKVSGEPHPRTGLKLVLNGFKEGSFSSEDGYIGLSTKRGKVVAKWTFSKLMEHWSRKHAKAVFAESEKKKEERTIFYRFKNVCELGIGTNFILFLECVEQGLVYLDPAIKVIEGEENKEVKARNQFRVNLKHLDRLYKVFEKHSLK